MKLRIFVASFIIFSVFITCAHSNPDFMVYNGKKLVVSDIKQITNSSEGDVINASISPDGNNIAYILTIKNSPKKQLIISKIPDLNKKVLLDASIDDEDGMENETDKWILSDSSSSLKWSPNGKYLQVIAGRSILSGESRIYQTGILVYTSGGNLKSFFTIPENIYVSGVGLSGKQNWNSRSNMIAFCANYFDTEKPKVLSAIAIANLSTNKIQFLEPWSEKRIELVGWSEFDGVQYQKDDNETREYNLYEVNPKNGKETLVQKNSDHSSLSNNKSSDGIYQIQSKRKSIKNTQTDELIDVIKDENAMIFGWTPNDEFLMYFREEKLANKSANDVKKTTSIWITDIKQKKLNHLFISFIEPIDLYHEGCISWSNDSRKMAYSSNARLYVAELGESVFTVDEKIEAGIPLNEEETKEYLTSNAKQLGLGLMMWCQDYDETFPDENNINEALIPYLNNENLFYSPGTTENIFHYIKPGKSLAEIEEPAETVMGFMDAGYDWIIELFADGHVKWRKK